MPRTRAAVLPTHRFPEHGRFRACRRVLQACRSSGANGECRSSRRGWKSSRGSPPAPQPLVVMSRGATRALYEEGPGVKGDGRAGSWVVAQGGAHLSIASWVEEQVGWERPAGPSQIWVVRRPEPLRGALPARMVGGGGGVDPVSRTA